MMFHELAIGIAVNLMVMLVHVGATSGLFVFSDWFIPTSTKRPTHARHLALLAIANAALLIAHMLEVGIWAIVFEKQGLVAQGQHAYFAAFATYTTLGTGDALQTPHTRLLEPMAAASGILMFGWSTVIILHILQRNTAR